MMSKKPTSYYSYLLRLWRVPGETEGDWRASLEDPATGERIGFASLEEMSAYLRRQIGLAFESDEGKETNRSVQDKGDI